MSDTAKLFHRYYFDRPGYMGGTTEFHELCRRHIVPGTDILEIGAGPSNDTSRFLGGIGSVSGADISDEVHNNDSLVSATVYDGSILPFTGGRFSACVSNYVLEHVEDPRRHFAEVHRVLAPGGVYIFRTPNLFHYVSFASHLLPHRFHLLLANWLRGLDETSHDPWPTVYRANTPARVAGLANDARLEVVELILIEKEPSYGQVSPVLFFPMMLYERVVNASARLARFRSTLLVVLRKQA